MKYKFLFVLLFSFFNLTAQNTFDIVFPTTENERNQKCQRCVQVFRQQPKEVGFSVQREGNNLFFQTNDKQWFLQLLKGSGDGLAIDVVSKDRYACAVTSIENTQIRGTLLSPKYAHELKRGLKPNGEKSFRVLVGQVPRSLTNKELEYNILFLINKTMCRYQTIYDLERYPWDLLDMGMYLDSLTYNTNKIMAEGEEGYILRSKSLKFKIPFEKNKAEYSADDIKPIYDSLRLTDFNIKTINIKAYSSVEGRLERNIELQEQRANSIAAALQTFQKPTIETTISSSENWVEFLNDIEGTTYENLKLESKAKIKSKLVGAFSQELEPILKNHRKAVLELELEKKDKYKDMLPEELLTKFNSEIGNENLDEAIEIQNSIFEKLNTKEIAPDFLNRMEVPKQAKFARIVNKNHAIKYMHDIRQSLIVYNELKELEKLVPKDGEVKYNIAAIKIKLWRFKALKIDENNLKYEINNLAKFDIDIKLIYRMLVNFHIIKAENLMRKGHYANKDKAVSYINSTYKKFHLSDYDYLSLAQFFTYYSNIDMAVSLLEEKVKTIDIDENLLFYYLNMTIVDKELTQTAAYRTTMLNALNLNQKRFCKIFNSVGKGGVTFQLLEDEYLRKTYCESCVE